MEPGQAFDQDGNRFDTFWMDTESIQKTAAQYPPPKLDDLSAQAAGPEWLPQETTSTAEMLATAREVAAARAAHYGEDPSAAPQTIVILTDETAVLNRSNPKMTEHVEATTTDRGFDHMPPIPSSYGGEVRAYESSNASGPHIWLNATVPVNLNQPNGPTLEASLHLTAENAWRLAEQLMVLVRDHYQGDDRPEQRIADLLDEDGQDAAPQEGDR